MKVYCENCKWFREKNYRLAISGACFQKDMPNTFITVMFNCSDYKRKWWKFWLTHT